MLLQILIGAGLFLGVGFVASRADRNEALAKRIAAIISLVVLAVLALSIVQGDFLRFDSAASDAEGGELTAG